MPGACTNPTYLAQRDGLLRDGFRNPGKEKPESAAARVVPLVHPTLSRETVSALIVSRESAEMDDRRERGGQLRRVCFAAETGTILRLVAVARC